MNVTTEYQITMDEYTEVMRQLQTDVRKRAVSGRFGRGIIGWVLFIGLAITLFILLKQRQVASGTVTPVPALSSPDPVSFLLPALPWLLIFGFVWFFIFRQLRGAYRKAFDSTPA